MKILDILVKESFDFGDDDSGGGEGQRFTAPKISVADLSSLQIRMLKILHDNPSFGEDENLRSKDLDMILSLQDDGLIDGDWALTDSGMEAISAQTDSGIPRTMDTDNNMDDVNTLYNPVADDDDQEDIDFNLGQNRRQSTY